MNLSVKNFTRWSEKKDRRKSHSSLLMVDSQAVKNTFTASKETKGFCFYKSTNGIKRHLAIDSLGLPFFSLCTKANVSDDQGLIEMFKQHLDYFKSKPMNIPKITVLLDNGYNPQKIMEALKELYPKIELKIRIKLSPKPSRKEKEEKGLEGFVPVKMRWIIERSNAWMEQCKSLVKNFERTLSHANAKIHLCFIRLMLKRLAKT